jgi:hypothetical protein
MGFPTKVQLIKRQASEQWYINFPSALAQAMQFSRGETVEWFVEDNSLLALRRTAPPAPVLKKTLPTSCPPRKMPLSRKCPRGRRCGLSRSSFLIPPGKVRRSQR